MNPCATFMPTTRKSSVCHICLQPESAHRVSPHLTVIRKKPEAV